MLNIGDFASHGRVSVRMLRHYDAIGLLRPARVDPVTGYRSYEAGQLARLNRVIALKELGFTLQQVRAVLDERPDAAELRGMLRLRRAQLAAAIAADEQRLARVEARLRTIESEGNMSEHDVVVKPVPSVRVAQLTGVAASYQPEDITPVIGPLFAELCSRVAGAGIEEVGPSVAHYEDSPEGDGSVLVRAAVQVPHSVPGGRDDFEVLDLPPIAEAATIVHRGSMDAAMGSFQALARFIGENGYRSAGYARERYLETPDDLSGWVVELQEPVLRR
ncbi:MerR family transcriptional regulator [Kitasatospora aureofaciens]|uniref:MerR family transcriptional regulator n=2 Tax=Streptomycetaceae TaxID=2062 RepID=A0A1E7MWL1_KITAU|nr:MerR family transcriptional regulator [Kitasatospora aureofaciens]QEV00754.1 MerR family transcriptional regulator [Streptomyces viridifaciens]ARF79564.1 MerR family transcriptional regulator [Kitasatospora aureofaciens]OEV32820.1 MerR family transcriptional regulator [Kitasatospora aureofaciens]UKZ07050.1 MerR family transcriptional regulator [Streptomyces viridifaciens]GGU65269.1 MerR family transcriptional regulator [Kitasatospora aureofaciens]